jgi:hypothetical protein
MRNPPLDSVLEEQARTSQPDPSRNPRSHSGLLEQGLRQRRPKPNRVNTRMPDLERGVYITLIFVDRFELQGRRQNLRLP